MQAVCSVGFSLQTKQTAILSGLILLGRMFTMLPQSTHGYLGITYTPIQ